VAKLLVSTLPISGRRRAIATANS